MSQPGQIEKKRFELILLGTGTCVPDRHRNASGYVVRYDNHTFMLDIGPGSMRRLVETNIDFRQVDVICLSHFHPDHISDLIPFLFATNYTPGFIRTKSLYIVGPKGLNMFFDKLSMIYGNWLQSIDYTLELYEMSSGSITIHTITLSTEPVKHAENSVAFRLQTDDNRSVTYSGDTGFCQSIIQLATATDLLLIECSVPKNKKMDGHLIPEEVGIIAKKSMCKKVVLTHFYPVFDQEDPVEKIEQDYNGEVIAGEDFLSILI